MSVEETVQRLGWEITRCPLSEQYRAECGGFKTPWRNTTEEVVNDVLLVKSAQNSEEVGPQKPRWI